MFMALALVSLATVTAAGCGDDALMGVGPDGSVPVPSVDSGGESSSPLDAGSVELRPAPEPPAPVFPATVGTLSVGVRVGDTAAAGSDDPFEVCFATSETAAPTNCQRLNLAAVNDLRVGGFDRYHFENVNVPRTAAKFVIVRPVDGSGTDALRLACLDVRFDGEPVHCANNVNALIGSGNAGGEVPALRQALSNACTTCESGKLVHGPKLGASGADKVRVWARTDATRKVGLYLSENADGSGEVPVAWAYPRPENDFAATLESAVPLAPDHTYFYRLGVENDVKTPFVRVRTELSVSSKVRVGMGSCAKEDAQPIYSALLTAKPDAFLFLGDNHYGNSAELDVHRYQYRRMDNFRMRATFLSQVHALATWDDHDYVENNSDGLCGGRAAALRGFKEAWPNPEFGTSGTPGAYSVARFGPLDVFMLDCRSYRPRVNDPGRDCDPGASVPAGQDLNAGPLGEQQYQWLMTKLSASVAPFKVIACGSLFTSTGVDSWGSFPAARNRFSTDLKDRNIRGVVLASGDIHRTEFRKLDRPGTYPFYELVSSPMARVGANLCPTPLALPSVACFDKGNSFVMVDVDATSADPSLTARIFDESGVEQTASNLTLRRSQLQ
jgi:alkaline phosphatase D